ncbi:BnaC05g19850D [Brassica napus]|uniref:BnaC05g19850D protein n=1 Tax=Brassica napus TaxID=3708 RepID=A0A078FQX2_BRANA|nr:BnaC05g19850D [Brassica napus]
MKELVGVQDIGEVNFKFKGENVGDKHEVNLEGKRLHAAISYRPQRRSYTFTRLFSPEAACEVIEAERHSHIFFEAEPDIWMVMVVEKNKDTGAIWRIGALRGMLREAHSLFVMFHGSVRALLEKEPTGGLTRAQLYPFITDYLSTFQKRSSSEDCCCDLFVGKKLQLTQRGTVQMLTLSKDTALEVQLYPGLIYERGLVELNPRIQEIVITTCIMLLGRYSLQHDKWKKGKDGFLVTDIWGLETGGSPDSAIPRLWLQQTQESVSPRLSV